MKKVLILILFLIPSLLSAREILLTNYNFVTIKGVITLSSIKTVQADIIKLNNGRSRRLPIYVVLDSIGGDLSAAYRFINFAKSYKNIQTICITCYSAASFIQQALPFKRIGTTETNIMIHRPLVMLEGVFRSEELIDIAKDLEESTARLLKYYTDRIDLPKEQIIKNAQKDWYFGAEEALSIGALDEIAEVKCSINTIKTKTTTTRMTLFGPIVIESSKCPFVL